MGFRYHAFSFLMLAMYITFIVWSFYLLRLPSYRRRIANYYWCRYSILFGLFLFGLPIVAFYFAQPILYGILVLEDVEGNSAAAKFTLATWASLFAASMVIATYRVAWFNAEARFGSPFRPASADATVTPGNFARVVSNVVGWQSMWRVLNRWLLMAALGLWIPAWCLLATYTEYRDATAQAKGLPAVFEEKVGGVTGREILGQGLGGITAGIVATLVTFLVMGHVQSSLLSSRVKRLNLLPFEAQPTSEPGRISAHIARLLHWLGPGYVYSDEDRDVVEGRAQSGDLCPGHIQLVLLWVVLLFAYLVLYWLTWMRNIPSDSSPISAMLLLLIMTPLIGFFVTGLAFFLDYYHIPTLLLIPLMLVMSYWTFGTSHYFALNPRRNIDKLRTSVSVDDESQQSQRQTADHNPRPRRSHAASSDSPPSADVNAPKWVKLDHALDDWKFRDGPNQWGGTMVVVAAAGGGIQAAAWTAQVLTKLDERFEGFGDSIGLVSGVSGGSVGLMYFLCQREPRSNDPDHPSAPCAENLKKIRQMAASSSLEATAWGMAFPDFIGLFVPTLFDHTLDRGWALELDWRKKLGSYDAPDETRISDWVARLRAQQMPIAVFNASFADSGEALILSQVVDESDDDQRHLLKYYEEYDPDPRVATAARLSATFSYVSPICQAWTDDHRERTTVLNHRIADGGYVDNSGLLTATRWTKHLIRRMQKRNFRNVLVLQIVGFPEDPQEVDGAEKQDSLGFWWEAFGPVMALNSARGDSQIVRGRWEIELATAGFQEQVADLPGDGLRIYTMVIQPLSDKHDSSAETKSGSVQAEKAPVSRERAPPLSWKLTPYEKQRIGVAWAKYAEEIRRSSPKPVKKGPESRPKAIKLAPQDLGGFFQLRPEPPTKRIATDR